MPPPSSNANDKKPSTNSSSSSTTTSPSTTNTSNNNNNNNNSYENNNRRFALGATYQVKSRFHGRGKVLFAWGNNTEDNDSPKYLASSGTSKVIHVFTKDHDDIKNLSIVDQIMPPGSSICTALAWDAKGEILCCAQENSSLLVFWYGKEKKYKTYDVGVRDITLIEWSNGRSSSGGNVGLTNEQEEDTSSNIIAIGTGKGSVFLVNSIRLNHTIIDGRKRRRVEIGKWNGKDTHFVFCCQGRREIYVAAVDGTLLTKIKTKIPVMSLLFNSVMPSLEGSNDNEDDDGDTSDDDDDDDDVDELQRRNDIRNRKNSTTNNNTRNRNNHRGKGNIRNNSNKRKGLNNIRNINHNSHNNRKGRRNSKNKHNCNILSVNLNGESLCFYNVNDGNTSSSVEISFQSRYGKILGHEFMSKYLLLVGFSGGYVVVLNIQYYNRELFCVELPAVRRYGSNHNLYNVNYVMKNNNSLSANTMTNDNSSNNNNNNNANAITSIGTDDMVNNNNNNYNIEEASCLNFQYFSNNKIASVYTNTHVTFIDLNYWDDNRADVMHLNFGGTDDHGIVISSSGSMISVFNSEGNVWHYATRFIFGKKEKKDIDLLALNKLILDFILKPISSYSLILSACIGIMILVSFIANFLNTSSTNFLKAMFGFYDMTL